MTVSGSEIQYWSGSTAKTQQLKCKKLFLHPQDVSASLLWSCRYLSQWFVISQYWLVLFCSLGFGEAFPTPMDQMRNIS